jgi:hypothetical protein
LLISEAVELAAHTENALFLLLTSDLGYLGKISLYKQIINALVIYLFDFLLFRIGVVDVVAFCSRFSLLFITHF